MSTNTSRTQSGVVMQVVGVVMVVAAVIWLFVVDEPFPMWLIVAGGGVMFLGVGAAVRRDSNEESK
jgi:drug/metabolite transporter superfamily protein YnfA